MLVKQEDDGIDYTLGILNEFDNTDWVELKNIILERHDKWKIKLASMINSEFGVNGLNTLLKLLETENNELIIAALDSLRDFEIPKLREADKINQFLMEKIALLSDTDSKLVKMMLDDLSNKMEMQSNIY